MIAIWQYVALGGAVTIYLAFSLYWSRRDGSRASAFFQSLETTVANALAVHRFVLVNKTYMPKSFGHRSWTFEGPRSAIQVFWDGKERQLQVGLRTKGPRRPVRKSVATISVDFAKQSDHQTVLDNLLDAITAAVATDA